MTLLAMMVSRACFWLGPLFPLPVCVHNQSASAHSFCQLEQHMPVFITLWSYIIHARVSIVRLASRHRAGLLFRALFAGILGKPRNRKPFAVCCRRMQAYRHKLIPDNCVKYTVIGFIRCTCILELYVLLSQISCTSAIQVDVVDWLWDNSSAAVQWKGITTWPQLARCHVGGFVFRVPKWCGIQTNFGNSQISWAYKQMSVRKQGGHGSF